MGKIKIEKERIEKIVNIENIEELGIEGDITPETLWDKREILKSRGYDGVVFGWLHENGYDLAFCEDELYPYIGELGSLVGCSSYVKDYLIKYVRSHKGSVGISGEYLRNFREMLYELSKDEVKDILYCMETLEDIKQFYSTDVIEGILPIESMLETIQGCNTLVNSETIGDILEEWGDYINRWGYLEVILPWIKGLDNGERVERIPSVLGVWDRVWRITPENKKQSRVDYLVKGDYLKYIQGRERISSIRNYIDVDKHLKSVVESIQKEEYGIYSYTLEILEILEDLAEEPKVVEVLGEKIIWNIEERQYMDIDICGNFIEPIVDYLVKRGKSYILGKSKRVSRAYGVALRKYLTTSRIDGNPQLKVAEECLFVGYRIGEYLTGEQCEFILEHMLSTGYAGTVEDKAQFIVSVSESIVELIRYIDETTLEEIIARVGCKLCLNIGEKCLYCILPEEKVEVLMKNRTCW